MDEGIIKLEKEKRKKKLLCGWVIPDTSAMGRPASSMVGGLGCFVALSEIFYLRRLFPRLRA
jgi:hypothetical protein